MKSTRAVIKVRHFRDTMQGRLRSSVREMCGASVVLGSATPSVESYYKAKTGEYELLGVKAPCSRKNQFRKVEVSDLGKS